jgi:ribosomal protein S21
VNTWMPRLREENMLTEVMEQYGLSKAFREAGYFETPHLKRKRNLRAV